MGTHWEGGAGAEDFWEVGCRLGRMEERDEALNGGGPLVGVVGVVGVVGPENRTT